MNLLCNDTIWHKTKICIFKLATHKKKDDQHVQLNSVDKKMLGPLLEVVILIKFTDIIEFFLGNELLF